MAKIDIILMNNSTLIYSHCCKNKHDCEVHCDDGLIEEFDKYSDTKFIDITSKK